MNDRARKINVDLGIALEPFRESCRVCGMKQLGVMLTGWILFATASSNARRLAFLAASDSIGDPPEPVRGSATFDFGELAVDFHAFAKSSGYAQRYILVCGWKLFESASDSEIMQARETLNELVEELRSNPVVSRSNRLSRLIAQKEDGSNGN